MDALVKQLHQRTGNNVLAMLFNLAAVGAGFATLATGWPTSHPAYIVAVMLALVYFEHCWTIIFHEDAHLMLYKAKWHNYFNGVIVGTILMVPFTIFRQVHIRHHAKMNTPADWELWPYVDPAASPRFRRWFLVLDLLLGIWMGPYVYGRIFWVQDSPLKDPTIRRQIWLEYAIIVVFWAALLGTVAYYGVWLPFVLAYLVPAWITGVVQTGRKLIEHLGLPADDPLVGARTIVGRGPVARFVDWTSYHIAQHGLHHLYPQMPHENLLQALEEVPTAQRGRTFSSYWAALMDTLPHFSNPGIGVNAPAQPTAATPGLARASAS